MSREHQQMRVRLPPELRDSLEQMAKKNGRSMNAEIVYRLQRTFEEDAELVESGGEQIFKSTSIPHPLSPDAVLVPQVIYNSQILNDELREVRELLNSIRSVMTDEVRKKVKAVMRNTDRKSGTQEGQEGQEGQ